MMKFFFMFNLESIPYFVRLLYQAVNATDRRSNGLGVSELCKGLSKLSVANDNKYKVRKQDDRYIFNKIESIERFLEN